MVLCECSCDSMGKNSSSLMNRSGTVTLAKKDLRVSECVSHFSNRSVAIRFTMTSENYVTINRKRGNGSWIADKQTKNICNTVVKNVLSSILPQMSLSSAWIVARRLSRRHSSRRQESLSWTNVILENASDSSVAILVLKILNSSCMIVWIIVRMVQRRLDSNNCFLRLMKSSATKSDE